MKGKLKRFVKSNPFLFWLYESCFQRPIINLFNSNHNRKVLFSYSTYHFSKKSYLGHSNYQESSIIASIFDSLKYQVDVVNNNKFTGLDLGSYDIIFGEGLPLFQAVEGKKSGCLTIYYGTGSHPFHCTEESNKRLISFYQANSYLALSSLRTSDWRWGVAASLCDNVICIGNEDTKNSFLTNGTNSVFCIDPSFHKRDDSKGIVESKNYDTCRKTVLWLGSYGLLHKGLDLAVEAFRQRPDWTLHVCGHTSLESDFIKVLDTPHNVIVHGFLNVLSDEFKVILEDSAFVILPSCSEGTATAVLTAVGNGGLIPLVTKECGFDVDDFGFKIQLSVADIVHQLDQIDELDSLSIKSLSINGHSIVNDRYTAGNYREKLEENITKILNGCK
ncbi:glycosyltransferase [Shewanella nanhaiensis]|uniref:Glycosyltransferase n=1 Tax=Shewanella nanhaiensis TaxID=2864872 RepID=A0ABS7E698_9GAMM|nr:glycosyltransferase [Shewanella nanhaiensis]MBW8185207.1 glycosyltransferase [Shewanella nanhaiensis]